MSKITPEELSEKLHLLRTVPDEYLRMAHEFVTANPDSAYGYFARSHAFEKLNSYELALADLTKALSIEPDWITYEARGNILRTLGKYGEALADYNKAEAIDSVGWNSGFGHLFRAECHARLGHEEAALADLANLRDDHWTPGLLGAPAGNKAEVLAELRRLATAARRK
jgi:tetratricopeptide (TPR) repeat protein